ncbi:MAG: hypothetical protein ACRDGM_20690 [bacterium]
MAKRKIIFPNALAAAVLTIARCLPRLAISNMANALSGYAWNDICFGAKIEFDITVEHAWVMCS